MSYLEITTRNGLGRRTVELGETPLRVGRSRENDIVLRDTRVSRHHCVLEVVGGRPIIRDLGSRRGIKVNNRRREESDLRPGDRVRVGPFVIALREDAAARNERAPRPKSIESSVLESWPTSGPEGDSDETATPDGNGLALADDDSRDESGGDSQGTDSDESGTQERVETETRRRLDELAARLEQIQSRLHERGDEYESLSKELIAVRDAQQAGSTPAESPNEGEGAEAIRAAIESQRRELASLIEQRDSRLDALCDRMEQFDAMADRIEQLESSLADAVGAAGRAETAEQRATESADRVDQFARDHEQLAFEHSQVAQAAQEMGTRLASIEESVAAVAVLPARLASLEEAVQQNSMNARQALEQVPQLIARLEEAQEQSSATQQRAAELAANQAESDAQVAAHEKTLSDGSHELVRLAGLIDEMRERLDATHEERAALNALVQSQTEQLAHVREWSDELEQRLVSAATSTDEMTTAAMGAQHEVVQRELGSLREAVESISVKLTSRIERLEGASADAAPELSALKEQVRRLSDTQAKVAAAGGASSKHAGSPPSGTGTAVMDRPKPAAKQPVRPTGGANELQGPSGPPASMDAEQSRKVMSRIFQPREEQDDRYQPVRDRSMIVVFVFVIIMGLATLLLMFSPMLRTPGGA